MSEVKIKEEPLDEIEDSHDILKQEQALMKQQIGDGSADESPLSPNNLQIVEEQDSIITVNAAEMRSEDEMRFIDSLNKPDSNKFKGVCSKCLKPFTNRSQFLKHTRRNHCVTKQWCPVCPVTFIDATSMLNHLNLHRENYFFCSQHCGANYVNLPLCEEHELKEHKIQAAPKMRLKYSCSFCRQGFKNELQLHVHWLQQTLGCGKLMQNVVLHSTKITSMYNDNDFKNSKNLLLDKPLDSNTTNPIATIPITKLRLKYDTTSTNKSSKRQKSYEEDKDNKRIKFVEKLKQEMGSNQIPFNYETDMQIKEEPIDDYESQITTNLIPEVIIKTEEEGYDGSQEVLETAQKPAMKNLVINNNLMGPELNGKFIPLEQLVATGNINNHLMGPELNGKFIPLEQLVATGNIVPNAKNEFNNFSLNTLVNSNPTNALNNALVMNMPNSPVLKIVNNNISNVTNNIIPTTAIKTEGSLRFVKIAPKPAPLPLPNVFGNINFSNTKNLTNAQLMSLALANGQNLNNSDIKPLPKSGLQIIKLLPNSQVLAMKANNSDNKAPIMLKLKTSPPVPAQNSKATSISPNIPILTTTSPTDATPNTVSIKLNCLEQNTTIDAEDFKKLQAEALIKAEEHRKNLYIPKTRLMLIENIPEKKQIIDNMKQQIAEVKDKTTEQIQSKPGGGNFILNTKNSDEPASLYLPILTSIDVELVQARYQYKNFRFKWICPYCMKDYELKTALKVHLVKAHNLNSRDMEKINVQAKPFRMKATDEPNSEVQPDIKEEPKTQETDSQTLVTSDTESIGADKSKSLSPSPTQVPSLKTQKQRYVCEKCDRTCSSKTMLNDHILANCSREPQYSCQQCTKKFYSHGTLQCHMSIHTGELPYKCTYCEKRFRTRGQVKVHHRTHTGERPFFCQVCSQRFTHRETLIAHLSRHIGMKRYKCYGCDKLFSCISALKTHREIRADTCGKVKFNPRAIGPRVRVIRGTVIFEPQPEINPYLKSEDPKCVLSELQNQAEDTKNVLTELQNQSEDNKTYIQKQL